MPLSAAMRMMRSACWKYFSLGVEKSPGVVKGPSPYRFTGPRNLCSIRLTMIELKPWRLRVSRYSSASAVVSPEMRDQGASPCIRNGLPLWSTRWRWSGPMLTGYGPAAGAAQTHMSAATPSGRWKRSIGFLARIHTLAGGRRGRILSSPFILLENHGSLTASRVSRTYNRNLWFFDRYCGSICATKDDRKRYGLRSPIQRIRAARHPAREVAHFRARTRFAVVGCPRQALSGHNVGLGRAGYGRPRSSGCSRSRRQANGEIAFD